MGNKPRGTKGERGSCTNVTVKKFLVEKKNTGTQNDPIVALFWTHYLVILSPSAAMRRTGI